MKQRIRLSILILWSFIHLLLFAFNGFGFNDKYSSSRFWLPFDFENWTNEIKNFGFQNSNFFGNLKLLDNKDYDFTEFIVYVITPILLLGLYNYIRHNQFKLLVDKSHYQMLEKQNNDRIIESIGESIKITPQPKYTNGLKALIYVLILYSLYCLIILFLIKKDKEVVKRSNDSFEWSFGEEW
jgi:hypothetical protein